MPNDIIISDEKVQVVTVTVGQEAAVELLETFLRLFEGEEKVELNIDATYGIRISDKVDGP